MKATEKLSNALKKLHGLNAKKKTQYLAVLLVVAIILAIYFSSLDTGGAKKTDDKAEAGAPAETISSDTEMEDRLKRVLSKVDGVGDVDVIINYESTAERVPAFSEDRQVSKSDSQDTSSETNQRKVGYRYGSGKWSQRGADREGEPAGSARRYCRCPGRGRYQRPHESVKCCHNTAQCVGR